MTTHIFDNITDMTIIIDVMAFLSCCNAFKASLKVGREPLKFRLKTAVNRKPKPKTKNL